MDPDFVMETVRRASGPFTITPRNPARAVPVGGRHIAFVNVASPPNACDMVRGKRSGDRETFRAFLGLMQSVNGIPIAGGDPVAPLAIHPSGRRLDCLFDKLFDKRPLTDKVVHAQPLGPQRVADAVETTRLAAGPTPGELDASPRIFADINAVSPLRHDLPGLDGAMRLARRGRPVVETPPGGARLMAAGFALC